MLSEVADSELKLLLVRVLQCMLSDLARGISIRSAVLPTFLFTLIVARVLQIYIRAVVLVCSLSPQPFFFARQADFVMTEFSYDEGFAVDRNLEHLRGSRMPQLSSSAPSSQGGHLLFKSLSCDRGPLRSSVPRGRIVISAPQ